MNTDFLIIGGGAVGLTSALSLLQSGYRVTLLERGMIGQEASWAGGGIMSPLCSWDYKEAVTRLSQRSMEMFPEAAAMLHSTTGIDPEYLKSGMLLLPPFDGERATRWCAQHQVELQHIPASDCLASISGNGLFMPGIAQVRNPRLLRALRRRVEMLGGVILEQHEVQDFEIAGDRISALNTTQGRFSAGAYIVTAGAWSKTLLGEHAMTMDIRPIRGQILLFKFDTPPFTQVLLQGNLYFIPRRDGHVLVGSTLEDVGFDKSTTVEARDDLFKRICALFPAWQDHPPVRHWAGLRPGSKDNIPTIGRHPLLSNLYANCGHFRYGVTMSLACAELLLNEIEGEQQSIDVYRWL